MDNLRKDISRLFASAQETEEPEDCKMMNGKLPDWLKGTLFQTGPGLLDLRDFTMNNYLDGYAILTKVEINGCSIRLSKRYPETESYLKAIEFGKPFFMEYGTTPKREGSKASFFSKIVTTFARDDMSDNCSASLYECGRHLIAASATSFFSKINPQTLAVEQRYDAKKLLGQNGYCVHPIIDDDGIMWNLGFSVPITKYNIVKIPNANRESGASIEDLLSKGTTVASISPRWNGALSLNHSFGITKKYIIFVEQPYVVKINRVLAATMKDYAVKDWLEWRGSEKNRFFIVEKVTGKVLTTEYLSSASFFFLHIINCYEDGNEIVVDIGRFDTPSTTEATPLDKLRNGFIDEVDPCTIARFVIPVVDSVKSVPENVNLLKNPSVKNTKVQAIRQGSSILLTPDEIFTRGAEKAAINQYFTGKKYKYLYAGGSFLSLADEKNSIMAHSIVKINADTKETKIWSASTDEFPGEPVFIPRKTNVEGEDDGVVIATVSSAKTDLMDYLVVIDGKSFEEICRASFENQVPMPMHTKFVIG